MSRFRSSALGLVLLALVAVPASAQQGAPVMTVPKESPRGGVSQTVGLTTISVTYDRPAVKGRKIWGGLVPFDTVWRAGANENTVLAVTSPFTVGGTRLPAGRYGLHTIPTASTWTIILSREASAWGSFSYNPAEDAVRFTVTPRTADPIERLQYTMEDLTDSSVTVTLRWEKLAIAFPVSVSTNEVVLDSLRQQLRGLQRFWPTGWAEAARWALTHNTGLDLAAAWADSAVQIIPSFANLRLKAALLERRGDPAGAETLRQQALAVATEPDVNVLGYQLLGEGKVDQAIEMFRKNVKDYPRSWNVYDSLGEALAKKGLKKESLANYQKALDMVQDERQKTRIRAAMATIRG
jgi:hypothetical protein